MKTLDPQPQEVKENLEELLRDLDETAASATAPASVFLSDDAYSPTNTFDELLSSIVPSVLYAL